MAGAKVLQFFLLILSMILSTHALIVSLRDGKIYRGFEYTTGIKEIVGENGWKQYKGCTVQNGTTYEAGPATTKVIVYIKDYMEMIMITLSNRHEAKRMEIAERLSTYNYELLYLGVHGYIRGDERLIAEFLFRSIVPNPHLPHFQIDTIGENPFDLIYPLPLYNLTEYKEESDVLGGNLLVELRSMDE